MYIQRTEPTFWFQHGYSDAPDRKTFCLHQKFFFVFFTIKVVSAAKKNSNKKKTQQGKEDAQRNSLGIHRGKETVLALVPGRRGRRARLVPQEVVGLGFLVLRPLAEHGEIVQCPPRSAWRRASAAAVRTFVVSSVGEVCPPARGGAGAQARVLAG